MGYSLSWVALKGGNVQTVSSALGLSESELAGTTLPTGWYVVVFNRTEIEDGALEKLSQSGEVICCFVEDHVMVSWASGWRKGIKMWSVVHDCEKGRFHLHIEGEPPSELKGLADRLIAEQRASGGEKAEVDHVYDAPAELAKALTGFRHDEDTPGLTGDVFEIRKQPTMHLGSGRRWPWGYVCLYLSTPIVALLYLLAVALFGERLPFWAIADPRDVVILALILHVLICYLIVRPRKRRRAASTTREG
jgi:hypothetical protein